MAVVYNDQDTRTDKAAALEAKELEAAVSDDGSLHKELDELEGGNASDTTKSDSDSDKKWFKDDEKPGRRKVLGGLLRNRKAWIGAGAGAGVAGLAVAGFMSLMPMRIVAIASQVQESAFGRAENSLSNVGDKLVTDYLIKRVVPGMVNGRCYDTISGRCAVVDTNKSLVGNLYNAWADNNFEKKLADNGIRMRLDTANNQFIISVKGNTVNTTNLSGDVTARTGMVQGNLRTVMTTSSTAEAQRIIKQASRQTLASETKWKQVYHGVKLGNYLERKYNIKRFVPVWAMNTGDWIDNKARAGMLFVMQRAVAPFNDNIGLFLQCSTDPATCSPHNERTNADADGKKQTKSQKQLTDALRAYGDLNGSEALNRIIRNVDNIRNNGFMVGIVQNLVETAAKATGKATTSVATKAVAAVPIVGWIIGIASVADTGVVLATSAVMIPTAIVSLNYAAHTAQSIQMYSQIASAADQQKDGKNWDMEIAGSYDELFSSNQTSPQGTTDMTDSYIYKSLNSRSGTDLASLLLPRTLAATGETCLDGSMTSPSMPVCEELIFTGPKDVHDLAVQYSDESQTAEASQNVWNSTIGAPFRGLEAVIGGALSAIGNVAGEVIPDEVKQSISDGVTAAIQPIIEQYVPPMLTGDDSGSRNYDVTYAGAVAAASEHQRYGLGGTALTSEQVAVLDAQVADSKQLVNSSRSLYARLFDTSDSSSLVMQLALTLPSSSPTTNLHYLANNMFNIFSNALSAFSSIFTTRSAQAASSINSFNITEYGVPADTAVFSVDSISDYADQLGCEDMNARVAEWANTEVFNKNTQQYDNTSVNECKLIETAVGSFGGYLTDEVLTEDDLR